ncbi:hypothetical protein PILCRDRAFT_276393 [Piloderma croceum F 1598]|uniref:Uncharacterized protein n=1 Tax=Piloderma croceum (strain F 1598) TaxID=765440 RepID=A0A0C3G6H0_PILCF|nr:hypothetical protein PILCRDRAFT_276393 [Piloderma croceum F 1598]
MNSGMSNFSDKIATDIPGSSDVGSGKRMGRKKSFLRTRDNYWTSHVEEELLVPKSVQRVSDYARAEYFFAQGDCKETTCTKGSFVNTTGCWYGYSGHLTHELGDKKPCAVLSPVSSGPFGIHAG